MASKTIHLTWKDIQELVANEYSVNPDSVLVHNNAELVLQSYDGTVDNITPDSFVIDMFFPDNE